MKKTKIEKCKWALRKPYLIDKKDSRYKGFVKYLKKTGISPDEMWSLDSVISEFILPRLKEFKRCHGGYPWGLTIKKWNDILDKMIFAFEWNLKETNMSDGYMEMSDKEKDNAWKKYEEGTKLFIEYFRGLWY